MNQQANLADNLKTLCEQHGTVSEACRKLGINRQQFNKYLAGTHAPSQKNLRLIANFFGLSVDVMTYNPHDFQSLIEGNHFPLFKRIQKSPKMMMFITEVLSANATDATDFLGAYERYHYSSIYKGQILRSIFYLYSKDGILMHSYVERFPNLDGSNKIDYIFKYHGFSFYISNRLFSIDFETIQRNEMTFSNLASIDRNSKKFMFGVTSGIAASMVRQPVAQKVAMHFVGDRKARKSDLRRATVLSPSDDSIPKEVITYLTSGTSTIDSI
ncbi:hypothetical protein X759_27545 [Mesorhizobium sp. LSHC420B00]|uniref:helix-turn-helix domain-containing protein n=1 Tax=unclassified Mesorhizobium TaxID=325217 RepID=UPI0003CED4E3|nr:helix-turn-helix transcriptional regulator [Mesorhizobium sp. LSHC420B00]ESX66568.1 hypothetical protein X759_27545 [Mesorhizobium sp. LSHC420B00]